MTSNEERIARLEGIAEGVRSELNGLRAEISGLRAEISDLRAEIRSSRNMVLMVVLALWMTTIGTLFGLFFGVGPS